MTVWLASTVGKALVYYAPLITGVVWFLVCAFLGVRYRRPLAIGAAFVPAVVGIVAQWMFMPPLPGSGSGAEGELGLASGLSAVFAAIVSSGAVMIAGGAAVLVSLLHIFARKRPPTRE
jgi:hypothetical protein